MCSIMEVLVVQAKAYLGTPTPEGLTALHCAAIENNSNVCSLLAAEVCLQCSLLKYYTSQCSIEIEVQ